MIKAPNSTGDGIDEFRRVPAGSNIVQSLTIVIPAYNEEDAIGGTIERCLAARAEICREGRVADVEVIVVSDGSTDRTADIARSVAEIQVIAFAVNKGYGAAIKEGFERGRGTLVGFLDADGTCDPRFFAVLCRQIQESGAEIALGSRLGPDSKMPRIRRIGNRIYALILGALCGQSVTDTASGMRVLRRTALMDLHPLPNGLHFTPAMSARALLSGMRIDEMPMTYSERVGSSKLRVLSDGYRFLRTIVEGVLWYRPERLFLWAFVCCTLAAFLLAAYPIEFYLRYARLEEWMIYRFIVCYLLGTSGFVLLAGGTIAHRFVQATSDRRVVARFWPSLFEQLFVGKGLWAFLGLTVACSIALVWPGFVEYITTAQVTLHWSRVMTSAFGLVIASIAFVTGALLKVFHVRSNALKQDLISPLVDMATNSDGNTCDEETLRS